MGQATSKGARGGGDAQGGSRTLGMGTGRSEWGQGAPSGDGGFFGRTREKLFEGPFQKGAKLLSVTTAQCDGGSFGKGAGPR